MELDVNQVNGYSGRTMDNGKRDREWVYRHSEKLTDAVSALKVDGFNQREIAFFLGISQSTVSRLLERAKPNV